MKLISIVLPVFNEEDNIEALFDILKGLGNDYFQLEFVFVNDGSKDKSAQILNRLHRENKNVKVIHFTRNFGHQAALMAGIEKTKGDAVINMDCDFQDPPNIVEEFIKAWQKGHKLVCGRRTDRSSDPFLKRITAKLYYQLLNTSSKYKFEAQVGDFRLMDRQVVNDLINLKEKSQYLRGMIAWLGYDYLLIDYERPIRNKGKSKYSISQMINLAMSGILNFSFVPLKVGFFIGLLSILVGSFFLVYIAIDAFIFKEVYPLFKWLVVVLFIFVGFLFVLQWILAEYIGRIYTESLNRPIYIIDDFKD